MSMLKLSSRQRWISAGGIEVFHLQFAFSQFEGTEGYGYPQGRFSEARLISWRSYQMKKVLGNIRSLRSKLYIT